MRLYREQERAQGAEEDVTAKEDDKDDSSSCTFAISNDSSRESSPPRSSVSRSLTPSDSLECLESYFTLPVFACLQIARAPPVRACWPHSPRRGALCSFCLHAALQVCLRTCCTFKGLFMEELFATSPSYNAMVDARQTPELCQLAVAAAIPRELFAHAPSLARVLR